MSSGHSRENSSLGNGDGSNDRGGGGDRYRGGDDGRRSGGGDVVVVGFRVDKVTWLRLLLTSARAAVLELSTSGCDQP